MKGRLGPVVADVAVEVVTEIMAKVERSFWMPSLIGQSPIERGSHRLNSGRYVTIISTMNRATKKGIIARVTTPMLSLATALPTNSTVPTGGVK